MVKAERQFQKEFREANGGKTEVTIEPEAGPSLGENWLDCMRSRKKPICDVEIGCRSVTVCHLGNLAYWNRRRLKWDPKAEKFLGDAEANTWLDRAKRGPWKT